MKNQYSKVMEFFLSLSKYLNKALDGNYSKEEVKENANNYYEDYLESKRLGRMVGSIPFIYFSLQDLKDETYSPVLFN